MKNKILKIITILGIISFVYFLSNDAGFCTAAVKTAAAAATQTDVQPITQAASQQLLHKTIFKFLCAMGGVVLSSLLIFGGLTIYNKIFVKQPIISSAEDEILTTPKTVDDAVNFFIKKNKIN